MDQNSTLTLNRLLTKLDSTLLQTTDPKLGGSQYERARISANLEHARTLLLTLEKQSATIRTQSQRQQVQTDLQQKRDLVKRLNGKLQDLEQSAQGDDSGIDSDSDEVEETQDLMKQYAPARHDAYGGIDRGESQPPSTQQPPQSSSAPPPSSPLPQPQPELRSRRPLQASDNRAAASTTAREHLFANRSSQAAAQEDRSDLASHEQRISDNRHEQDTLTTSMLSLAQALKHSAQQMGVSIESEREIMKRAEGGLDKSAQGMEAAERRMGMLRRMSEGQGWWGRVKLYGFIFALWVGCFLLVFLGPKLRL
ncbi:hypothetical protein KC318_g8143 [Hortaea werneckii]|uniref:t-SNARE coiled-coil homology domain-containing protein n=1 Tax=Hortaea werneckii TaxID=91943 RepID=A0A3M6ZRD9_HORWE|nr:hypothetical protein KC334_g8432 [Hortaea werneckii]KAI7005381.1 hypothetical protein KC355_g8232 [Hortaea werneckii]KAI7663768.1 hypothetical protein KC318_g8143 [Hortaea werneckii]RMX99016.1 hypothetical protein D0868_09765 [Hortaea werneckii]RMY17679.1 hypothetical protein D0867_05868 [Hortaea werneckii]